MRFGAGVGSEQEVIKAFGPGWNVEILAELVSWASWRQGIQKLRREEASSWARGTSTESSLEVPSAEAWPASTPPALLFPSSPWPSPHRLFPSAVRVLIFVLACCLSQRRVTHLCREHVTFSLAVFRFFPYA